MIMKNKKKKIFFVGAFYKGSIVDLRAKTLENLGNYVERFNTFLYESWGGKYFNYGLRKTKLLEVNHLLMNKRLAKRAIKSKPDILWIDKGRYVSGDTLREIKKQTGAVIIYETLDYMFASFNRTPQFISSIPLGFISYTQAIRPNSAMDTSSWSGKLSHMMRSG